MVVALSLNSDSYLELEQRLVPHEVAIMEGEHCEGQALKVSKALGRKLAALVQRQ